MIGEPTWTDRYPVVMEFIGGDVVVAHNAAFDIGVIRETCVLDGLAYPTLDFLCTMVLAAASWRCRATGYRLWPRHSGSRSVTTTTLWPTPATWRAC